MESKIMGSQTMTVRIRYGEGEKFASSKEIIEFLGESGRAFSHDDLFSEVDYLRTEVRRLRDKEAGL